MKLRMMFKCRACGAFNDTTDRPAVAKCSQCQRVHYTPEQAKLVEGLLAALTACPCGTEHDEADRCPLETFVDYIVRKLDELGRAATHKREAKGMHAWEDDFENVPYAGGMVGEA